MGVAVSASALYAADGSGTNSVSPTTVNTSSTGNTLSFTFTAAETMDSGEVSVAVPTGWSAPQGTSGTAGYTTVTSASGMVANVEDALDTVTGWTKNKCGGLTADSTTFHEGTASMYCSNLNGSSVGASWYKNVTENWSGYTKIGFWIQSSVAISSNLQFFYDDSTNGASPLEQIDIPAVAANTWAYVVLPFGSTTRTSIASYGFMVSNTSINHANIHVDDMLIGPGSPTFLTNVIHARVLQLANTQTLAITYGSGGGTSGATAPSTAGTSTFTTQSRVSDSGTLTNIASSPTVSVSSGPDTTAPTVTAFSMPSTSSSLTVSVSSFTATDNVGVTGYLITSSATAPSASNPSWSSTAPTSYTFASSGSQTAYAWAKDAAGNISTSMSATVTITLPDTTAPTVTAFSMPSTSSSLVVSVTSFTATDNVGVTGYLITNSATTPSASDPNWSSAAPTSYAFASAGTQTAYAWAKDAAGNISTSMSATVTITLPDTTAPTVTAFSMPSTASSLVVSVTSFTATDNVGVTGYLITSSATAPSASDPSWSSTAPTSYAFTSSGSQTAHAWAKDAAGNVSTSLSATVTITLTDTTAPTVTAFSMPSTSSSLTVSVSSFTATDNVGVTGYLITSSATAPSASNPSWSSTAPTSYTFASSGSQTAYAWAKDAAGNISASVSATVTITTADTTAPTVTAFSMPSTSSSLTVSVSSFTATDNVGVTGYLITSSATAPSASNPSWSSTAPSSYTFASSGTQTAYAWAKDAAGNISTSMSATVTISVSTVTVPAASVGGVSPTNVSFSGQAYPGGTIAVLEKSILDAMYQNIPITSSAIQPDGTFSFSYTALLQGKYLFVLRAKDKDSRESGIMSFTADLISRNTFTANDLLFEPTVGVATSTVTKGDPLQIDGYAAPGSLIQFAIDNIMSGETRANQDGSYSFATSTVSFAIGSHTIQARQTAASGQVSDLSPAASFTVSSLPFPKADLNGDNVINITDWSIFLYRWSSTDPALHSAIDMNGDGKVDITDLSIFLSALRK
ncbi:hypothetical protein KGO95_02045 [Patescibacteria group bacterium]|nr:hypothetical protein [Patescibacteria group bacterium]